MTLAPARFFLPALSAVALFAQKPVIQPGGVLNAASQIGQNPPAVAPQMLVTIRGQNLATSTATANGTPLPSSLGGATVTFSGTPAPLLYASPTQINVQAPSALAQVNSADLVVTTAAGASDPLQVLVTDSSYGIFTQDGSGCGPGVVYNVHADGSISMNTTQNSFDPSHDVALTMLLTGMGYVADRQDAVPYVYNPADNRTGIDANVFIGAPSLQQQYLSFNITYAGPAPARVGVDQINLVPLSFNGPPEGCSLPLYFTDFFRSASQLVNVSVHKGGGTCVDPAPDSLGLVTWQKNVVSDANAPSSAEGVQVQFRQGNLMKNLLQYLSQTANSTECCSTEIQPPLSCTEGQPGGIGAGTVTVTGATEQPLILPATGQATLTPGTLQGGTYQVAATGGAVGAFQATANIPAPIKITTNLAPGIMLQLPATVAWTGGDGSSLVTVELRVAASPQTPIYTFDLKQIVSASAGSVSLPASFFIPFTIDFVPHGTVEIIVTQQPATAPSQPFTAPGLTLGGVQIWNYVWDFRGLQY
jgi:uncharacterized protein (TIGR03437 family)